MRTQKVVLISALLSVFIAGNAFAQSASTSTTNSLSITSNPVTTSVSPGTNVPLGTITLTSPGGSYSVNSIPVSLAVSGGALANNLSNCRLYNLNSASTSTSTTTALGPSANIVSGSNSFALSPSLTVTSGTPMTLQIRCDVSAAVPSGSMFQFTTSATSSSTGTTGTQTTGASLAAQADFVKQLPVGLNNAIVGIITLDATHSNQPVTLTSVPISVTAGSGATLNALTNCTLTSTTGTALTTGGNSVAAITGSNMFKLDTPLTIPAGQGSILVLRCNVSSNAPVGGTLTVGLSPASFQASANGSPVTVTQGLLSSGQPGTNSASITLAQQGSGTGTSTGTPSSPGIPNTGAGGDAPMNFAVLIASLLVAIIATRYAMRSHKV